MLLITPDEVIARAFSTREQITSDSIRLLKIDVAQERYIRPRFGDEFFDRMCEGQYADFVERYIKPALAQYVRYSVVEELSVQMSDNGAIIYGKTDELTDSRSSTDGAENQTKSKTDTTEGSSAQKVVDSQSEKLTQSNQTDKETFVDHSIANYPQENSSELATVRADATNTATTDTSVDQSEQLVSNEQVQVTQKNSDLASQNKVSQTYRVATHVERKIIAAQALSDANVLLAKAVRYVERNEDQFDYYLPKTIASRVFF